MTEWEGLNKTWIDNRILQLETSNICNLNCPGCARQKYFQFNSDNELEAIESYKKQGISLQDYDRILSATKNIKILFYNLSVSDPIYSPTMNQELEIINLLDPRPMLQFSTNGSHRSVNWWNTFKELLRRDDRIEFAIDGLEDTNHIYRVNSNWQSIINGVITLRNRADIYLIWRYIVFEHNYHQIQEAYELSKELGFDQFKLIRYANRTPNDMKLKSITWDDAVNKLT